MGYIEMWDRDGEAGGPCPWRRRKMGCEVVRVGGLSTFRGWGDGT